MVVSDIINHSREFRRAHNVLFPICFICAGIALSLARLNLLGIDGIVDSLASTYPTFMLVFSYIVISSVILTYTTIAVCLVMISIVIYVATRNSTTSFFRALIRQIATSTKSWLHIYLFALILMTCSAVSSLVLSFLTDKPFAHFVVNNSGVGILNLISYIGNNWIECWFILSSLFCFGRMPGSPPLRICHFAFHILFNTKTDLVYTGCKYYALLFGSVQYVGFLFNIDIWYWFAPLSASYIVSMYLLCNGMSFNNK